MKIVAVVGKSDTGKSTVIKNAVIALINMGYQVRWMSYAGDKCDAIQIIRDRWETKKNHNVSDIRILLEKEGKIICVVSVGDSINQIKNAYERTMRHACGESCDMFVCACHPDSPAQNMLAKCGGNNFVSVPKPNKNSDVLNQLIGEMMKP